MRTLSLVFVSCMLLAGCVTYLPPDQTQHITPEERLLLLHQRGRLLELGVRGLQQNDALLFQGVQNQVNSMRWAPRAQTCSTTFNGPYASTTCY